MSLKRTLWILDSMYLVDSTTLEEQRYVRESFEYGEELSRYDMFFNVKLIKKL